MHRRLGCYFIAINMHLDKVSSSFLIHAPDLHDEIEHLYGFTKYLNGDVKKMTHIQQKHLKSLKNKLKFKNFNRKEKVLHNFAE